jgi:predicted HicB family RNase H-like nuclease
MSTPKFTLRFRDRRNHEILSLLADRYGVSMNQLAEEMLERELQASALLLEQDLAGTLTLLRNYRRDEHLEQAIADFAQAEAYEEDPIKAKLVAAPRGKDVYGVAEAFD